MLRPNKNHNLFIKIILDTFIITSLSVLPLFFKEYLILYSEDYPIWHLYWNNGDIITVKIRLVETRTTKVQTVQTFYILI